MQRHWEGAHFREEVERRAEELASIALQDVDRYKWLPEWRHDLAQSVLGPRFEEEMVAETKIRKKKKRVSGFKARRKTSFPNRFNDDLLHSKCRRLAESSDLLRFFSTQNGDLQKLLVDGIVNLNSKKGKDLAQKGYLTHKDGGEPTLACELDHKTGFTKDRKPTELGHSSCTAQSNPIPAEAAAPWGFRDWTYDLSTQQSSFEIEDFCTDELRPQTAGWTSNASCRLTNSSRPLSGWCGKADTEDGACRDVTTRKGSNFNLKTRDQSREIVKSGADHSSQTSLRRELTATERSEEDIENLQEQTTVNVLQRWAEPLDQYLSDLQIFEEELRKKWLTPEEKETTPISGAQTSDLEPVGVLYASNSSRASETKIIRVSSGEVEALVDTPLSNRKYGGAPGDELAPRPELTHHGAFGPIFDNSQQENCAIHGSMVKPSMQSKLWLSDKHFRKPRPETVPAEHSHSDSETLHSRSTEESLIAAFRSRKPFEWWPTDDSPRKTTKPRSAPGISSLKPKPYRVNDSRTLLGKPKREQIPEDKTRQKPEWWPALRRPYSASELGAMRQKADREKATKKPPNTKMVTRYPGNRLPTPSSSKSQRRMRGETEFTPECMARQDEDSLKPTLQIRNARPPSAPLRKNQQEEYRKKMEELQKAYGYFQKTHRPRNLSTVDEQLTTRKSQKCKTGHGGLHALQKQNQLNLQRSASSTAITAEEHVSEIITQFQLEKEFEEAPCLLHQSKTPRKVNIQSGVLSQKIAQKKFPTMAPVVELHNEKHEDEKTRKARHQANFCLQRRIERLADKLIDQAVNEVASELAEFCETVADQMYMAEFMT